MIVVDEIETFINGLDLSSPILSAVIGATSVLTVENVYHARVGLNCIIDGFEFEIISVNYDANTVEVNGTPVTYILFEMPVPFYFHGTPYATNAHISRLQDSQKVPMIYLLEIIREQLQVEDSSIETIADLRLFFLDVANFQDWTTDQHYSNVIRPMRNLLDAFIDQARNSPLFGELPALQVITHVKFGVYQDSKGHLNSLFNDRLSGIELNGSFPFYNKCC